MPCLEISMPKVSTEIKELLAKRLTDAFVEATGFEKSIFAVRYHQYAVGSAAVGGELWPGDDSRPYLHFLLYCPRLHRAAKQKVVSSFTAAFTETIGKVDWKPVIHIGEHPYDNVGVGGALLSDTYEELANRKFYYDTSDE